MGLMGGLMSFLFGDSRNVVVETTQVFRENARRVPYVRPMQKVRVYNGLHGFTSATRRIDRFKWVG
jgi:hypothetical protein